MFMLQEDQMRHFILRTHDGCINAMDKREMQTMMMEITNDDENKKDRIRVVVGDRP